MASSSAFERIALEDFTANFSTLTEHSSVALGGTVQGVSDEFFADAFHLLLVEPAPSLKGQFGPKGALFSGWETRRHNPDYDWCIIKLGTTGIISGFDIDTAHFNGNEAPEVTVQALHSNKGTPPTVDDARWTEILPRIALGPSSRHLLKIQPSSSVNYVKLNMYPDGGIARFRVYGDVSPVRPQDAAEIYDMAHVFAGGRVIFTSDQHFGVGSNLILPGRGKDMGDGWETKRSRQPGHKDWAIIKLGDTGLLSHAEIDTAHFKGNFPESCELHAAHSAEFDTCSLPEDAWTTILPRTKLGPHRQHQFQLENIHTPYTHVRITIHPDGGVKRVRLFGRRHTDAVSQPSETSVKASVTLEIETSGPPASQAPTIHTPNTFVVPALALTPETFSPFGQVIQSYPDINAVPSPRNTKITGANQGTAIKYHKLAPIVSSYSAEAGATAGLSVYHCQAITLEVGGIWPVKVLERHPCTNQAFIPMGPSRSEAGEIGEMAPGYRYLVIVSKNGEDDRPDLKSLRAFVAFSNQGIVYDTGIWHHPMAVLEGPLDFTCVETQVGNGEPLDYLIPDAFGFFLSNATVATVSRSTAMTAPGLTSIRTSGEKIEIVNQLLLPHTTEWLPVDSIEQAHDAIKSMKIRGAPAIASLAALAIASHLTKALQQDPAPEYLSSPDALKAHVEPQLQYLYTARPTAVNLGAATRRLTKVLNTSIAEGKDARAVAQDLIVEGKAIDGEDVYRNKEMSKWGGEWLVEQVKKRGGSGDHLNVMTVCNTGSLATSGYGTALGLITYLHETRKLDTAFFTQSTPYHQGSRLTAFELISLKIPSVMLCDSMVGSLFQHKGIHGIAVGADRIAKNGDTANKVGTYNAAVLAARHNIPFIVVAPVSTVDLEIENGSQIPIEHRPPLEARLVRGALYPFTSNAQGVKEQATVMVTPEDLEGVYNPSFDVTPAELITAIVTERGVAVKAEGSNVFDLSGIV
ncbi:hypothetical protein EUX98_g1912 [Antrodiella citrinella]|uniref:Methylthioribose-1-phosphate isomerase n=1 Tax=Antrodiella citrinella TaxID=2447956 RepID=A0A4S4N3A6_9APHY|nr:hypothetical protein EUX98_g1912 [Antrodiella citrinella]